MTETEGGPIKRRLGATRRIWARPEETEPLPELPAAQIDEPRPGSTIPRGFVHLAGWALTPEGPVDRIEITVNGEFSVRARLGLTRRDLPKVFAMKSSLLGGYQCVIDLTDLPESIDEVTIAGTALGRNGEVFDLPPATYPIGDPESETEGGEGEVQPEVIDPDPERSALLRRRSMANLPAMDPALDPFPATAGDGPKILAVTHNIALGGGQLVMLELLERFANEHGMTGSVVAPRDGATRDSLEAAGYAVHISGEYPVRDVETYEARLAELVAWAAPQNFDLVLVNTVLSFPGGDLAERLGLPAIWVVHESYGLDGFWATFEKGGLHPYARERGAESFAKAAAIIFEVEATLELFRKSAGDAPLLTLPYGIDIDSHDRQIAGFDRDAVRQEMGYGPDDFVVLCMGTLEPRKGQVQLVEAFSRVAADHPEARLVLVGALDNGYDQEVRDAIDLLGIGDQVDVHAVSPDIARFYVGSDLLVCASDIESLPRTVLEAMAFRLPVMATDVFGLPEVIDDGVNGWIVESRDTAALARGLDKVMRIPRDARAAVAEAARKTVEDEHGSPACAARYADVIRDTIKR